MKFPRKEHIKFYEEEIKTLEDSFQHYMHSRAIGLYEQNRLYVGKFWGIDKKRGNVILRHKKGKIPRIKKPYTAFNLIPNAPPPSEWNNITYYKLRLFAKDQSGVIPIYLLDNSDDDYTYIGYSGFDLKFAESLVKQRTSIIVAENEPPLEYLINLKNIVTSAGENTVQGKVLFMDATETDWSPIALSDEDNPVNKLLEQLNQLNEIIIQGPPGTGKTYLMAELCSRLLDQNKSVVVTALSNKALTELAEKPQLKPWLKSKHVYKTNLSTDEQRKIKGLKYAEDLKPVRGVLKLATYYQLSKESIKGSKSPHFDFLIIEEASQTFLATIAAFKPLAKQLLIIGDPKQLPPVVSQNNPKKIHKQVDIIINGLETYAYNTKSLKYRKIETYRLNRRAAEFTGMFYNNTLVSVSKQQLPPVIETEHGYLFHENGGPSCYFIDIAMEGKIPKTIGVFLKSVISDIHANNPKLELSILSPFVVTTKMLQEVIYPIVKDHNKVTIDTIDRVQGMTCDITFFVVPYGLTSFSLHLNRFNVATSRSRLYTVLLTDSNFKAMNPGTGDVGKYWEKLLGG